MKKIHYVYRVTSLIEHKHYYGVRSSKNQPKLDLGIKYFTSSCDDTFREDFKSNPNNYKCVIVRTFNSRKEAMNFEKTIHNRLKVDINEKFYNKTRSGSFIDMTGFKHTDETKNKMSIAKLGKEPWNKDKKNPYNSDTLKRMSKSRKGIEPVNKGKKGMWKPTAENLDNLSKAMKGRKLTEATKEKLRKPKSVTKNYKYPKNKVECPHCGKIGGNGVMQRWHFDMCKQNIIMGKVSR